MDNMSVVFQWVTVIDADTVHCYYWCRLATQRQLSGTPRLVQFTRYHRSFTDEGQIKATKLLFWTHSWDLCCIYCTCSSFTFILLLLLLNCTYMAFHINSRSLISKTIHRIILFHILRETTAVGLCQLTHVTVRFSTLAGLLSLLVGCCYF